MINVKISSTGSYIPEEIQSASDLSALIRRSENWIVNRTGVKERRISSIPMEEMAAIAARKAIASSGPPDCIVNASVTPVQLIPDSSTFIQEKLGLSGIPCWSVHSTCLSFLTAFINSASLIQSGIYKKILLVSAETATNWRDLNEPESASLFGDAAAAVMLEATPKDNNSCILDWEMKTFPEGAGLTEYRGAGTRKPPLSKNTQPSDYLFHMKGPKVFKLALTHSKPLIDNLLARNQLRSNAIDRLIMHQSSGPGLEAIIKMGFERDKVVNIVSKYGNCVAASIPMTLAYAWETGLLSRGDKVLIGGTGAGLSVAAALLEW